jgi:transcription elongation GreA/GreB family factor
MEDYEVERERDLLSIRLRPIQDSLLQYEIVDTPNHAREVCIGLEVTIQRYDENDHFRVGAPTTYTVGDYVGTDLHAKPHPLLSYTSPIMSALMGKKVDVYADHYPIRIGDRTIYVELLDIKLPQTVCTVRQLAA